jgi:O-antigen ligase
MLCAVIAGAAVTLDVLVVQFPFVGIAIAALLVIAAQIWGPLLSLAVVLFTCGLLSYSPYDNGALSRLFPGDIAIGCFLIMWLLRARPWSLKRLFQPTLLNGPLLGVAVVTLISMAWSRMFPDPSVTYSFPHSDVSWAMTQTSQVGLLAATICMPFAVATAIKSWRQVEAVVVTVGIVSALGTLLTIAALLFRFGGDFAILGATRAYWEQPWHSSMPLNALILPFLYAGMLFGRRSLSAYGLVCVLVVQCSIGVVLTFSRECWLLALFGISFVTALRLRWKILLPIALIVLGLLTLSIWTPRAIGSVTRFYNPDEVYGLDRAYFYVTGLQLFVTHPFLGVGAGNYQFFDRVYAEVSSGGIAHNQFLTLAAETGVPGLLLFFWFLVVLLRIRKNLDLRKERVREPHYWLRAAGSVFVLVWIAECFFQEAFFISAAAGGGTKTITGGIFAWILLGVLFAIFKLSQPFAAASTES